MKRKLPLKSIILSLILAAIGIVHLIYGSITHDFQWIWIVLCFGAAAVSPCGVCPEKICKYYFIRLS